MELDLGIISTMDFYHYIDYPYNCIDVFKQKVIINEDLKDFIDWVEDNERQLLCGDAIVACK